MTSSPRSESGVAERRAYEPVSAPDALLALESSYNDLGAVLQRLDGDDYAAPTLCSTWVVSDLVFHTMLDAQRALIAFATPSQATPDVDYVTYWRPWSAADPDAVAHARFVRLAAAAYASPATLVAHRRATADATVRAAAAADCEGVVSTQGHSLSVPDFVATLAVEATVHHLDLVAFLEGSEGPAALPLALVRRTLDGLAGGRLDLGWDDRTYALKGTGRSPLSDEERARLGDLAAALPLFS